MECIWRDALLQRADELPAELIQAVAAHNHELFLEELTKAALSPQHIEILLSHCSQLLAQICVTLPRYGDAHEIVATLGRIVPAVPHLTPAAVQYLTDHTFDVLESPAATTVYLLGHLRLIRSNAQAFMQFVQPDQLALVLEARNRTNRYLAIRILQLYLRGADAWLESMIKQYIGEDKPDQPLEGSWDDLVIDYRFLSLWEESRARRLNEILYSRADHAQHKTSSYTIPSSAFDARTALIGQTLLLRAGVSSSLVSAGVCLVPTTQINLDRISKALQGTAPLLISGPAGCGKSLLIRHTAEKLGKLDKMVTLHLNEQSDAKLLVGIYTSGETPGSIVWRPGVLTTAVREGRWVLIEDIDRAPGHIIGSLLQLIEDNVLSIPNRKQNLHAKHGFRLIATTQTSDKSSTRPLSTMLGRRYWHDVSIDSPNLDELSSILAERFPQLQHLLPQVITVFSHLRDLRTSTAFMSRSRTGIMRQVGSRDLIKWCSRIARLLEGREDFNAGDVDDIFLEAVDCFVGALPQGQARSQIEAVAAAELHIDPQRRDFLVTDRTIQYQVDKQKISIGRYVLSRERVSKQSIDSAFSTNPHTLRMMERIAATVVNREPLLLVGETGVGKTTSVQHLATHLGKKLVPFNLSQQSEAGDLLGGFKPVNVRAIIVALQDEFEALFTTTFSHARNQQFLGQLGKYLARGNWKAVCKLWHQALKMVSEQRAVRARDSEAPNKRRKIGVHDSAESVRWDTFSAKLADVERRIAAGSDNFAFAFVEGNIVKALRNGDWILLDEINLASSDTLEALVDLFDSESPSLLLTEAGNIERLEAHPAFRVFAAMNPATDVGKKDLPPSVRSRFTELYVESPDKDMKSLQAIVTAYLRHEIVTEPTVALDVSKLYREILALVEQNKLVDGAGQRPHFSLRTLTRTLSYARYIAPQCNLRRALYEGFQMSFMTFLDAESSKLVMPLLERHLAKRPKQWKSELRTALRKPEDGTVSLHAYPGSKHWIKQGPMPLQEDSHYIITPFVQRNLENLVRAASTRQFPVLVQGPTSSGKTSMIEYLANRTGHKFVRINNHEHTDLQEYLGTYVSTPNGKLEFQEGLLVQALRQGHWIVLDELNLAPTDVLEALNRLLDDNRELLIPETQEVVRPHQNFMLFATQNPAGLYGGRKVLSRAFRNRFLELHFDDIPIDELQEILQRRNPQLAESRCAIVVAIYRELAVMRQQNRMFEQKSFATLRDLFRWAMRRNDTIEELAHNGFMLLAERVRNADERTMIKDTIEKVMSRFRVKLDESDLYSLHAPEILRYTSKPASQNVVWTKAMRRLYILVSRAIENNEAVLLVGDTGCGKTTVCQMLADAFGKDLHVVNAHQNTETGDLIGSQRPVRNRSAIEARLRSMLMASPPLRQQALDDSLSTEQMLQLYADSLNGLDAQTRDDYVDSTAHTEVQACMTRHQALFEWVDGALVTAMKTGSFFLLDEISLADDAVLERLNSVLETSRSILLAEKGSLDSAVTAAFGFHFLATMNPGGDYGKRELSPALRNRFTEIWVPSISDADDIVQIMKDGLVREATAYAPGMLEFAQWFKTSYDASNTTGLSMRDILAWKSFVNVIAQHGIPAALVHGAAMVYIDTLGANPAGLMSLDGNDIEENKAKCLAELSRILNCNAERIYHTSTEVELTGNELLAGPFSLPLKGSQTRQQHDFNFAATTTKTNALRVVRALQLSKPVLLEGKPGVGKTALITALADSVGVPLTRINLSEQTDLIDLFGADAPVDGSETGTFAWRVAPFLRAMKAGEWVLLDEMNLASQSVLEGLNAVLDHRGKAFIPELGMSFDKHPDFRVFAAQNPHHQGGGRKGLPASFVNRFTVVYADAFKAEDLLLLSRRACPEASPELLTHIVDLVRRLEHDISGHKQYGVAGSPWEFNYRDVSKWMQLLVNTKPLLHSYQPLDISSLIFTLRFRNKHDRAMVTALFHTVFGKEQHQSDLVISVSESTVQLGCGTLSRSTTIATDYATARSAASPTKHIDLAQAVMTCIQNAWPVLLSGPSGCGKTNLVATLATLVGAQVQTCVLSAETDAMDLLGGYEQIDMRSSVLRDLDAFDSNLEHLVKADAINALPHDQLRSIDQWRKRLEDYRAGSTRLGQLLNDLSQASLPGVELLVDRLTAAESTSTGAHFSWVDGILVDAMREGKWLVLDNANLCSASVLDRLNSLLEKDGVLILSENVGNDGSPRMIKPHADFRIFLLTDPRHGELSRAMRNRVVELYCDPMERITGCSPIVFESALQRFHLFSTLDATGSLDDIDLPQIMDRLGLRDHALLPRFLQQLRTGIYGPRLAQIASQQVDHLVYAHSLVERTHALVEQALSVARLPADFTLVQTPHPLNNQPLFTRLQVEAASLGYAYDMFSSLLPLHTLLRQAEEHMHNNSHLLRIEQQVLPVVKSKANTQTSSVLRIVDQILDTCATVVTEKPLAIGNGTLATPDNENTGLVQVRNTFNLFCSTLRELLALATNAAMDGSMLGAAIRLLRKHLQPLQLISQSEQIGRLHELIPGVKKSDWGNACVQLWTALRPNTPRTAEQYHAKQDLVVLIHRFDQLALQFNQPLDRLANTRSSLQRALRLTNEAGASSIDGLIRSIGDILFNFEVTSHHTSDITTHFHEMFSFLMGDLQLKTSLNDDQPVEMHQMLSLLAQESTAQSVQQFAGNSTVQLTPLHALWRRLAHREVADVPFDLLRQIDQARNVSLSRRALLQDEVHVLSSAILKGSRAVRMRPDVVLSAVLHRTSSTVLPMVQECDSTTARLQEIAHDSINGPCTPAVHSRMWIQFAVSCLRAFLPSTIFDPAAELVFEAKVHRQCRTQLQKQELALRLINQALIGRASSSRSRMVSADIAALPLTPEVPGVYRPTASQIPELFVALDALRRLITSIENKLQTDAHTILDDDTIANVQQLRSRLESEFDAYADFTGPIIYFIDCLAVAKYVSTIAVLAPKTADAMPFDGGSVDDWLSDSAFCALLSPQSSHKQRLAWLSAIATRNEVLPIKQASDVITAQVEEQFGRFYESWRRELNVDQKQHAAKSSLYKYRGGDILDEQDELDELSGLFPTFDDEQIDGKAAQVTETQTRTQDLAYDIATVHQRVFSSTDAQTSEVLDLLQRADHDTNLSLDPQHAVCPAALIAIHKLHMSLGSGPADKTLYDFYVDENNEQALNLSRLTQTIVKRFSELQIAWPEHAVPIEVLNICKDINDLAYTTPLPRFLPVVEKLYNTMTQWQGVASSEYSVTTLIDSTAELVVSWRRLELSSWRSLFDREDHNCTKSASSWWFTAYEVIIVAAHESESKDELGIGYLKDLVDALKTFLESCGVGEYLTRLRLLRGFVCHIQVMYADHKSMLAVAQALSHLGSYYGRFTEPVNAHLKQNRVKFDKEINEIMLLASWKDRNVDSLRQSAKSSHKKLFKVIRKYRNALAEPVTSIIVAGAPEIDRTLSTGTTKSISTSHVDNASLVEVHNINMWNDRPQRYQNIDRTEAIMRSYVQRHYTQHTSHERLATFIKDVKDAALELRKATPVIKTSDNEPMIGSLKNQKRRLLADVLRGLRAMGLQHNLSQDMLQKQASLSIIFAQLPFIDLTSTTSSDALVAMSSLFRFLDSMQTVRDSARKHSEDLTSAEVARCVALLESILQISLQQYTRLSMICDQRQTLVTQVRLLEAFAASTPSLKDASRPQVHHRRLGFVLTITEACIELLQMHESLTMTDLSAAVAELRNAVATGRAALITMQSFAAMPYGLEDEKTLRVEVDAAASVTTIHRAAEVIAHRQPETRYVIEQLQLWTCSDVETHDMPKANDHTDVESWTAGLLMLLDDVLGTVEHSLVVQDEPEKESMWLRRGQDALDQEWSQYRVPHISSRLSDLMASLPRLRNADEALVPLSLICRGILPLVQTYLQGVNTAATALWSLHAETNRLGYTMSASFISLAKDGFCAPSDKTEGQGQSDSVESGTGLGDGEGAEDISKDIENNEDLSEMAQEPNKQSDDQEMRNEKDAVDMADEELEGETADADAASDGSDKSEQGDEADNDDIDEEVGSVDDDTANALDEKMWDDGKVEEQQDKEASSGKGTKEDQMAAADNAKAQDEQTQADDAAEENDEAEMSDNGDNVERPELEGTDPHLQEQENLDLPDDLNMDGQSVDDGGISESDLDFHDAEEDVDMADNHPDEPAESVNAEHDNETASANDEAGEASEPEEEQVNDDTLLQNNNTAEDTNEDPAEGVVAGEQGTGRDQDDDQTKSAPSGQADRIEEHTEPSDAQEAATTGEGSASAQQSDKPSEPTEQSTSQPESSHMKQLGDVLEQFFRQNKEIEPAGADQNAQAEKVERPPDVSHLQFEHLNNDMDAADAQAVGTGSMEQSRALPEESSVPVDDTRTADEVLQEEQPSDEDEDMIDTAEQQKSQSPDTQSIQGPQAFVGSRQGHTDDIEMHEAEEDDNDDEGVEDMDLKLVNTHISNEEQSSSMTLAQARQLWSQHESSTRNLALMLTEHLRLILQPTQATKMRGDFRTGKRLNIKKIIPYIASSYKRDKIWMRRTTPTKRNYQIMLAIDDSKSMAENDSKDLAFSTLAMVTRSLSMLEAGELCVLSFGEDVTVAHDFNMPFASEAGPELFKTFTFNQNKTNVHHMLNRSIELLQDARLRASGNASELWQLEIIISDGQCEDHSGIRQLVRQAQEERVMIVFVVVDAGFEDSDQQPRKSILDLPHAEFVKDENGEPQLKMSKYFDTFPFNYYLVVRDVQELPGVLAAALRQWFAEVADTGSD